MFFNAMELFCNSAIIRPKVLMKSIKKIEQKEKEWKALCRWCVVFCGAFDDPCQHLKWTVDGIYFFFRAGTAYLDIA
jgi:hypothetical protein